MTDLEKWKAFLTEQNVGFVQQSNNGVTPPMTKDAIAGRIRRLLGLADRRARELGIPDTEAGLAVDDELV